MNRIIHWKIFFWYCWLTIKIFFWVNALTIAYFAPARSLAMSRLTFLIFCLNWLCFFFHCSNILFNFFILWLNCMSWIMRRSRSDRSNICINLLFLECSWQILCIQFFRLLIGSIFDKYSKSDAGVWVHSKIWISFFRVFHCITLKTSIQ
jgi:hypothetical protein